MKDLTRLTPRDTAVIQAVLDFYDRAEDATGEDLSDKAEVQKVESVISEIKALLDRHESLMGKLMECGDSLRSVQDRLIGRGVQKKLEAHVIARLNASPK